MVDRATDNNPPEPRLPRWGSNRRDRKAQTILRVMQRFGPGALAKTEWVDLGCGSGGIAAALSPHVLRIIGVDPEPWPQWREFMAQHRNLVLMQQSVENLTLPDGCADVVVCNQVYEHVPDPQRLIAELQRILRPGGHAYFAGPNLLFPIEPHLLWPFVHWLPRRLAVNLMRLLGAKKVIDANLASYWTLKKWLKAFEVKNALPDMISDPDTFEIHGRYIRVLSVFPRWLLSSLTWLSPGFVFVLRKPAPPATADR